LGLNLLEEKARALKIKDIVPGMFSIDIKCKIAKMMDVRTFSKNGMEGAVQNILLGDETGFIRMSIWNEEIKKIDEMGLKEGSIIRLSRVMSKEDNIGNPELRLGRKGSIEIVENEEIILPASASFTTANMEFTRKTIDTLSAGDRAVITGTLVQVFKRKPYYEVCEKCNGRLEKMNEKWFCKSCGEVNPKFSLLVSGVVDDGYGNIRAVFFRENAEKILGTTAADVQKMVDSGEDPLILYDKLDAVGRLFNIEGVVKENSFSGKLELLANNVNSIEANEETKRLLDDIEKIKNLDNQG
ncbi:MAG: hypothetical protein GXO64_01945, partial [Candidatus Micrarchaeota archaeon]|nr:hypothetical protein [Candidatus Micrarchaeota archaeon]